MSEVPISRDEAVQYLAEKSGLTVQQVKALLQAQAELVYSHADVGFPIPGIGVMKKMEAPSRKLRMPFGPKAGQEITIRARKKLNFRLSRLAHSILIAQPRPLPDLFSPPGIETFKFSTAAIELPDFSIFCSDLGGPFTSARDGTQIPITVYRLQDLNLPSGRIVATDALLGGGEPFARPVPPGRYPLGLIVAQLGTDSRIALVVLRFTDRPAVKWNLAGVDGHDSATSKDDEKAGYGVDSGTGSLSDAGVHALIAEVMDADGGFYDRVIAEMKASYQSTRNWVHLESPNGSLAIFSSGFGDGRYASYFGLDSESNPAALVTDFKILKWSASQEKKV